ncbi:MAG: COQ9 family protein [Rickettsiales bacterium]|jgi:ubiquinone biosynthesis protein COQ9|nr:COQ9 family protein [Rickettsiales bacterium]
MSESKLNDSIDQEKMLILTDFLKNAPFDRWSYSNLKKSAEDCGFSEGYTELLFPKGIKSLTEYFHQLMNKQMEEEYLKGPIPSKISDKIAWLIELKLKAYSSYRLAIPSLMQYNLIPINICQSQKFIWQSCSRMWYLAGDNSTDYNHYTKRAILEYVYSTSLMFWLSDESPNYIDTKEFIAKKIKQVLGIGKWKESALRFFRKLGE